ncbi:MAG: NHLP bacteriocin export ABC transporter permease/ATPase subunit [Myxococcota bacterium]
MMVNTTSWSTRFRAHGEVRQVGGNHAFDLSPGGDVIVVLKGAIDVFATELGPDGSHGRRHELLRLEAGESAWPLAHAESGETLVAIPLPDTHVLLLKREVMVELARAPLTRDDVLQQLARWMTAMAATQADAEAALAASQSSGSVSWLRVSEGIVLMNGQFTLSGSNRWWMVPPTAWFKKRSGARFEATMDSAAVVAEPPEHWLDPLLSIVDTLVAGALTAERERLHARLDARRDVDADQWQQALTRLGTAFEPEGAASYNLEDGHDALVRAMGIAAKAAGCKLTPLTTSDELDRGQRVRLIARASRVPVREVALKETWWRDDAGPMLAFIEETGAPVALLPAAGGYRIIDPTGGPPQRVSESVASTVFPLAWSFYRTFEPRPIKLLDLWRFGIRNVRKELLTLFGVGALAGLVALAMPIATGIIFSDVIPGGQRNQIMVVAMGLGVAALAMAMFGLVQGFAMIRIDVRFGGAVQAAIWHRLLALPVSFYRDFTAGDLATRAGAIDEIRETLSASTISAMVSTIFSSFNLILLFSYDPQLALVGLGLVVIALAVSVTAALAQLSLQREEAKWQGKLAGLLMQLLSAVGKVRTAGAERRAFAQWSTTFSKQVRASVEASHVDNMLAVFSSVYPMVTMITIFGMVATSAAGTMNTGQFLAFNAAFSAFLGATLELGNIGVSAISALPAWERAKPILDAVPESHALKADPGRLKGGIELQRVSFQYAADTPMVLRDISLDIKPGECVAIVGPSGSGKSTLLRLLLGFEVPTTGAVYFDGHDLERVDLHVVRRQLGVVLQDGAVMSGDIYSNIAGANQVDLEDAWEAARQAALDEEIRAMPMGMHTVMPEGGGTLSGGQRQRLLIARALVRKPRILLFDEATSALDNQSQAQVTRSVDQLKATRIIIAHRLTTIRHVDRILVLKDGVLVEQGSFKELMTADGVFAKLARRQMVGSESGI